MLGHANKYSVHNGINNQPLTRLYNWRLKQADGVRNADYYSYSIASAVLILVTV